MRERRVIAPVDCHYPVYISDQTTINLDIGTWERITIYEISRERGVNNKSIQYERTSKEQKELRP